MKFVVPYLTKTRLIELNSLAGAQPPRKALDPEFLKGLSDANYPIVQATPCRILSCTRVTIAFGLDGPFGVLDIPFETFRSLPDLTTTLDHDDPRLPQ